MKDAQVEPEQMSRLSTLLRMMSGQYDQASRSATAY
jgi:predicted MarR family transcription regulator